MYSKAESVLAVLLALGLAKYCVSWPFERRARAAESFMMLRIPALVSVRPLIMADEHDSNTHIIQEEYTEQETYKLCIDHYFIPQKPKTEKKENDIQMQYLKELLKFNSMLWDQDRESCHINCLDISVAASRINSWLTDQAIPTQGRDQVRLKCRRLLQAWLQNQSASLVLIH